MSRKAHEVLVMHTWYLVGRTGQHDKGAAGHEAPQGAARCSADRANSRLQRRLLSEIRLRMCYRVCDLSMGIPKVPA
jgi:hypothetical protein